MIVRALPLGGNAHRMGCMAYLETPVDSGIERPRISFHAGDIAYMPAGRSICFFTEDCTPGKTMTPVGRITSGIGALSGIKAGHVMRLYAEAG